MVRAESVLQFLILILIRINVNAAHSDNTVGILSKLLSQRSSSPLIIIVKNSQSPTSLLRASNNQIENEAKIPYDDEKTMHYVKEILRSTGDKNDPIVQKTNNKYKQALRARCNLYTECSQKCESPKKKKKEDSCKKSCKDTYDYFKLCNPPGGKNKKQQKKQKCPCDESESESEEVCGCSSQKGKTMPPTWRY